MTTGGTAVRFVLIRHGESHANVERVLGGHRGCTGLTARGRDQAARLHDRLLATGELADACAVVTSRLARAIETAELLGPTLGDGRIAARQCCDVCDVHWGVADGKPLDVVKNQDSVFHHVAEGGESWLSFTMRSQRALRTLVREHSAGAMVVVTHGGVIKASFAAFGHSRAREYQSADIEYTSLTVWSRKPDRPWWDLASFNDTRHLEG